MKNQPNNLTRQWHHLDAKGKVLGRLATEAAVLLRGKHKPSFRNHIDVGDTVVITNAAAVAVTGNKETNKRYIHHTGYPGGLRTTNTAVLRKDSPEQIIVRAVSGMLPKNRLRDQWLLRLKVYAGSEHPHVANITKHEIQKSKSEVKKTSTA